MIHPLAPVALAIGLQLLWLIVGSLFSDAVFGDNVEQFVWAQQPQWGYRKHPPLPTWILFAAQRVLGTHWWLPNLLAAVCWCAAAWLTWSIVRRLADQRVAAVAVLLWTLMQSVSWRSTLFNHNTVMVLAVAAVVYCSLRAREARDAGAAQAWWAGVGIAAAAAILSKYQAALPLACIGAILLRLGVARQARHRYGIALASLIAAVVLAPHLNWLAMNDYPPLRYAAEYVGADSGLIHAGRFAVALLKLLLLLLAVAALLDRAWPAFGGAGAASAAPPAAARGHDETRIWVYGLAVAPILIVLLLGLLFGVRLQNHWSVQTAQFVCLPLALWLVRRGRAEPFRRVVGAVLVAHALSVLAYVGLSVAEHRGGWGGRSEAMYPAKLLTDAAHRRWRAASDCPLRQVVGPQFEAGLIGMFSDPAPRVVTDPAAAEPRFDAAGFGALFVSARREQLPADASPVDAIRVGERQASEHAIELFLAARPPSRPCAAPH